MFFVIVAFERFWFFLENGLFSGFAHVSWFFRLDRFLVRFIGFDIF